MEILNVSMGQAVHCFKWGWIQQKVPFSKDPRFQQSIQHYYVLKAYKCKP